MLVLLVFVGITESGRRRRRRRHSPPPCSPRTCQVSSWSTWSSCTHQCGTSGTQTRARTKTVIEACGGSCPHVLSKTRSCNRDNCQNSGTPTSNGCSCPPGYNGTCCEIEEIGKCSTNCRKQELSAKKKLLHDQFSFFKTKERQYFQ